MSINKINLNDSEYNIHDNTLRTEVGDITSLNTADKSTVVGAVNELLSRINTNKETIQEGLTTLTTSNSDTIAKLSEVEKVVDGAVGKEISEYVQLHPDLVNTTEVGQSLLSFNNRKIFFQLIKEV